MATPERAPWPTEIEPERFNPLQEEAVPLVASGANLVVAAPTASGKTVVGEMACSMAMQQGKRALYLCPMRALTEEKIADWAELAHPYSGIATSVLTGEFVLTKKKVQELKRAWLVCMTSEMLAVRTRNQESEKSAFLRDASVCIVDESHLLTDEDRGGHLEAALEAFTHFNPDCRLVLLSATMPNCAELGEWCTTLNGKPTEVLLSDYRPVKLNVECVPYADTGGYYAGLEVRESLVRELTRRWPDDQFLVFVHSKAFGRKLEASLRAEGESVAFHNADKQRRDRLSMERRFREGRVRVLISTKTLAWGCNLPARRLIVVGVTVGRGIDIATYDVQQMIGRAGRPKYDTEGDAYVLVPRSTAKRHERRIREGEPIVSTMTRAAALREHLLAAIYNSRVHSAADMAEWYKRTFAYHQLTKERSFEPEDFEYGHPDFDPIVQAMEDLLKWGMALDAEEPKRRSFAQGRRYRCTRRGMIVAQMYFRPDDAHALTRNFGALFSDDGAAEDDLQVARAYVCRPTLLDQYVTEAERRAIHPEVTNVCGWDRCEKAAMVAWTMLRGEKTPNILWSIRAGIWGDLDRTLAVLQRLDAESSRWGQREFWRVLRARMRYGVPPAAVPLLRRGFRAREAKKLVEEGWDAGDMDTDGIRDVLADLLGEATIARVFGRAEA